MNHQYSKSITHNTRLKLERHLKNNTQFYWGSYFIVDKRDIKDEAKRVIIERLFAIKPHIFSYVTGINYNIFNVLYNVGNETTNDVLQLIVENTCGIDKFVNYVLKNYCTYGDFLGVYDDVEYSLKYDKRTYHVFRIS